MSDERYITYYVYMLNDTPHGQMLHGGFNASTLRKAVKEALRDWDLGNADLFEICGQLTETGEWELVGSVIRGEWQPGVACA